MTNVPDAEALCADLLAQVRPDVSARTVLVGVHTGGAWIAERLHRELGLATPLGFLDISFYRDDFARVGLNPQVKKSTIPVDIENAEIILIDDVLQSGRTVRAAMNELFDYGRPARIDLAVLIDRGARELPIAARYVATMLALPANQGFNLARAADGKLSFSLVARGGAG